MKPALAQNYKPTRFRQNSKRWEKNSRRSLGKELAISMQNFEGNVRHREERRTLENSSTSPSANGRRIRNKPTIGKERVAYDVEVTGISTLQLEGKEVNKLLRMERIPPGQNETKQAVSRAHRRSRASPQGKRKTHRVPSFSSAPTGVGENGVGPNLAESSSM